MNLDYYKGRKGVTSTGLKMIALIIMLVDHIGASIVERYLFANGIGLLSLNSDTGVTFMQVFDVVLRIIGRIAFPVFCFCIVEGFHYTRSRVSYMVRMFLFAVISEAPFDFAFSGKFVDWSHQNVFMTLGIAILALWIIEDVLPRQNFYNEANKKIFIILIYVGTAILSEVLRADYGALGIVAICVIYSGRMRGRQKAMAMGDVILTIGNLLEISSFLSVVLIHFYTGKRGRGMKYFFYIFYPVHLLILGVICKYMGI